MKTKCRTGKTGGERGSELLEMALTVPLLLLLAAGIVDFANAWHVRQILANAAREGARLGATQPMLDLDTTNPQTVQAICQDVADYLAQENLSTAFMNGTSSNPAAGCATPTVIPSTNTGLADPVPLGWTYYSSGTYGLKIQRTVLVSVSSSGTTSGVSSTEVTLTFPFKWPFGFNHIANWISGQNGAGYAAQVPIAVDTTMANTD
jgi:Flp pilus assembly protein TadG